MKNKFVKKVFTLALTVIAILTVSAEPDSACKITDNTCMDSYLHGGQMK